MGNGIQKASEEVVSPPSSPLPKMSNRALTSSPLDDSSPKKRRRSSKKGTPSPGKKKSSKIKGKNGKLATPEGSPSKKRRREKRSKNPILVENEDENKDGAVQKTSIASLTKKSSKKDYPTTLDARVHRLRHMGYVPGSVSAFTPASTEDGQVVVARDDGSYELKAITSSTTGHHRLITIGETLPITGRKAVSQNPDDGSDMEDDIDNEPETCPDAASSLCWVYPSSTPICVGSGPNGNVWIVDFKSSRTTDIVSSGGGGIFDLTTCKFLGPNDGNMKSLPFVAGACEDGSVRVWRVSLGSAGQGQIQDPPLVTLPSAGAPILSLAWKNVTVLKQGRSTTYQTVVFAAVADGTIRKYGLDIEEQSSGLDDLNGRNNGGKATDSSNNHYSIPNQPRSILRMTIESKGRKDPTKVWSLLLLQDNTLVAGTSLGQVQFWNGETGTLTDTVIQSNSQADVLKIVANSDETKLFCSGVDSRVVCLERKKAPKTASTPAPESELTALVTSHLTTYRPWKMTISQRPHTHDVKAMAIVTSSSKTLSSSIETLLTGGLDTKICSYSVSSFAHTQPQTWKPWPSATSLFSSTSNVPHGLPKLMSMQRHDRIELYQLESLKIKKSRSKYLKQDIAQYPTSIPVGTIQLGEADSDDDEYDNEKMVATSSSPLQASALSSNGKYLAVSNASSTYLFNLKFVADKTNGEASLTLKPEKIELPGVLQKISATAFYFTDDELYIGYSSENQKIHILRLHSAKTGNGDENQMDTDEDDVADFSLQTVSLPEYEKSSIDDEIVLPISSIHLDGEFMVTSSHAREHSVHVFRRSSSTASFEHFWTLPSLGGGADARPAAVTLIDGKKLAIATYRSHLYLLDIETRSLNEWSEQYGFPIREKKWTEDLLCGRGYPLRLIPQENGRLIMVRIEFIHEYLEKRLRKHDVIPLRTGLCSSCFLGLVNLAR